ncbi:helix-turn-helix transcriptional regulator [Hymenobacter radiodurans]|uniref:helix-turn-helix transcriptional regulator n=1 Tax=Hymenobacter radiodurans TaxID=2496028 RepID=UPI001058FF09|nr:YafY family protein [Hymenobacter radiodurans]
MNRFDRITAILIQLQAKRSVKGQDLAERFDVSLRTVYRDLRTLEEAGVPLCGEPGVGYSLAEGYRLPPVMFTREEATALSTAEKLVSQLTDAHTAQLSHAAMDKLRAVLRRPDRDYLEALSPRITVLQPRAARTPILPPTTNTHQLLLTSIAQQLVVRLDYRAGYNGVATQRDVEPIGLYFGQYWHVVAFCRLRQEFRNFRLDRIAALHLCDEHFAPRPDTLQSYWQEQAQRRQAQAMVVRFAPEAMGYVQENKHYFYWTHEQLQADGWREMTFLVECLDNLARWLLVFTTHVTIVSPPELKQRMRELAEEAHHHFCA